MDQNLGKTIKIVDPNGLGLWKKDSFTLYPGLTFLVGCNGSGKTSTLEEIKLNFELDTTVVHLDARRDFHITNLEDPILAKKGLNLGSVLQGSWESEHEAYERLFSDWVSKIRPSDEYKGKSFVVLIDGIDSGGDVFFYNRHLKFFNFMLKDIEARGIIGYLVVTCNNFYYLCHPELLGDISGANCLWLPSLEYKGFFTSSEFENYTSEILSTVGERFPKSR